MGLKEKAKEVAEAVKEMNEIAVVHHIDADGLSAGGIMCRALEREEKKFTPIPVKQLYTETIEEIRGKGKNHVFLDFGSGQKELLVKKFGKKIAVIDHHQPTEKKIMREFNPMQHGVDGGTELSGAGAAYLVAKEMDAWNADLAPLAIVGAVGDMQDSSGKLLGENRKILGEAEEKGLVKKENDLRLYGRVSRPLTQFLVFASNPFLPGLTANEEGCKKFLNENGFSPKEGKKWGSYEELGKEGKKRFANALLTRMVLDGESERKAKSLIGEVYTLLKEKPGTVLRDAKEYSTLLNACGRHGMGEVGLSVCKGDRREGYGKALALLAEHRKQLKEGIGFVQENGVKEKENFYFFDSGNKIKEEIVGIVAGMLYGGGIIRGKPIIAFAEQNEAFFKVSGRGTQGLVEKGLNIGKMFREICTELGEGAEGGGHKIAAGCRIRKTQKEKFLEKLGKKLKAAF